MLDLFFLVGLDEFLDNNDKSYNNLWYRMLTFLNLQEKQFSGRFVLVNEDEQFNKTDLNVILKSLFWFGRSGATKYNNIILPIISLNSQTDIKNNFIKGTVTSAYNFQNNISTWKNIERTTNLRASKENTVIINYNSTLKSPFLELFNLSKSYAAIWEVYDKDIYLSQKMIVTERPGKNTENGINKVMKKFKWILSTSQQNNSNSLTNGLFDKKELITGRETFGTFQMNHSVDEFKKTIDNIKSEAAELMGYRTNINFKKERQITGEIDYLDIYFDTIELLVKNELDKFFNKLNKITNKEYSFITVEEMKKKEEKEKLELQLKAQQEQEEGNNEQEV